MNFYRNKLSISIYQVASNKLKEINKYWKFLFNGLINKRKALIIMILVIIVFSVIPVWSTIVIVLFALIYGLVRRYIPLRSNFFFIKKIKAVFLFVLLFIISIKLLVFDVYKIPSSSMENKLYPGDIILVNKLAYGPKLPHFLIEIPVMKIWCYFNNNRRILVDRWDFKRLPGFSNIKQGDIFVFNSVWSKDYILVKRCVALPGDLLRIKDGAVYTNNQLFNSPDTEKNNYKFKIKDQNTLDRILKSFDLSYSMFGRIDSQFYKANLSTFDVNKLKKTNYINTVSIQIDSFDESNGIFCKLPSKRWTFDNLGPFVIPKEGLKIYLNPETYQLYEGTINTSERSKLVVSDGNYYVDNRKTNTYTFKQDYYFMMGDNRKGTMDSRAWGFVPKSNIIGKVQSILYSNKM